MPPASDSDRTTETGSSCRLTCSLRSSGQAEPFDTRSIGSGTYALFTGEHDAALQVCTSDDDGVAEVLWVQATPPMTFTVSDEQGDIFRWYLLADCVVSFDLDEAGFPSMTSTDTDQQALNEVFRRPDKASATDTVNLERGISEAAP